MTCTWLIGLLRKLLPPTRREWPEAMLAELNAIPEGIPRQRYLIGCVWALSVDMIAVRLRSWVSNPETIAMAFAAGIAIATLDRSSDSRRPLWTALIVVSALLAWWRPVAAWRWGLLVAAGVPILAHVSDGVGPYAFDPADTMYGVVPAIVVAVIAAGCRRLIRPIALILAVFGATAARDLDAQTPSRYREITASDIAVFVDSAFADYLKRSSQPSLALVVVKDGAIIFAQGYGAEDAAGSRRVDPDSTVFWFASLSKVVTADAVMRELERGNVALNAPVTRFLDVRLPTRRGSRPVTLEDLLTHTHGFDEPFMQGSVDDSARLMPLCDYLKQVHWRASVRPGEILRYSNHGMALAGCVVERASGLPFAEYVQREIFGPLLMTRSTFLQPIPSELSQRIATAGTDDAQDFLLPSPAGAMVGTATDMGRFLIAQLNTNGARAGSLSNMHATHWRGHPDVPGVALGWFETHLGGVRGLYHTGARHHFSAIWMNPASGVGLFLVHSMRQGGPFQNLRSDVVRAFVERYFVADTVVLQPTTSLGVTGLYRPELLSTSTVERAGYFLLDTPVQFAGDSTVTMRAPGGLGTFVGRQIGNDVFEVRDGPQTDLRLGFFRNAGGEIQIAMGGTLLDPTVFTRMQWWQRGMLHGVLIVGSCFMLAGAAVVQGLRWVLNRTGSTLLANPAWRLLLAAGVSITLAAFAFAVLIFSTPETGAAEHMRNGLRVVLTFLTVGAIFCAALPFATALVWQRRTRNVVERTTLLLFSVAAVVTAVGLWHYRMVGFNL